MIDKKVLYKLIASATVASVMLMTGCSKKETPTGKEENLVTPILSPTGEPTAVPTPVIMTPAPGVTITTAPEVTVTPVVILSKEQAEKRIAVKIDLAQYQPILSDQILSIDNHTYYVYTMQEDKTALEPKIAVDQETGTLYFYDADGNLSPFTKFPIDSAEKVESGDAKITVEQAKELLESVDYQKLGLLKELSGYTIIADEWTTVANGQNCYCFNVFEQGEDGALIAMYYVSIEGDAVYTFDEENGEYIRCN